MKVLLEHQFINHPENLRWLQLVIEYVGAQATNSPLLEEIINFAKAGYPPLQDESPQRFLKRAYEFPEYFVSNLFFSEFIGTKGERMRPIGVIDAAFELLEVKGILYKEHSLNPNKDPFHPEQEYRLYKPLVKYLIDFDLLYNHLFGFSYIINKYTSSVIKIEVVNGQETSLGTGWILDINDNEDTSFKSRIVVTNEHVITGSSKFRILTKDDIEIPHTNFELLENRTKVDIAIIKIEYDSNIPAFIFNPQPEILDEIITMGYPSIPLSNAAYQVVHKGEINALVTDYWATDLLLISARTSPGNSGSPVVDDTGRVVGMVTRELFERTAFEQKGITPYSACLPASTIIAAINQSRMLQG